MEEEKDDTVMRRDENVVSIRKRLGGRRKCGWSRVWSLSLGGASYPTSKSHLSILGP
jgi:hypothetical protein